MSGLKILFIGNSFTNRNDVPGLITRLAGAAHPPCRVETERIIANGMALKSHWERGAANEAIRSRPWDYVVLQEQSTLPLKNRSRMHEYITLFDEAIRSRGAKTVLYLTWARQNVFERQDELTDAYLSIGRKLGTLIAPVGVAWKHVLADHPEIFLHDRDKSHPNPMGSYLAACVFFSVLMKRSPVGLPVDLPGIKPVDPQIVKILQEYAWSSVA